MKSLHINLGHVLELYNSIRKSCPKCGELMVPLGDPPMESYLWCFNCKVELPLGEASSENASAEKGSEEKSSPARPAKPSKPSFSEKESLRQEK